MSPLGDNHVRLDWVISKWQYQHVLERLRQHINNLRSEISRINESSSEDETRKSGAQRITPAEAEYDLPQLYDDRTTAQRWSHFLLDILETGLVLTSSTAGKVQDHLSQHDANDDGQDDDLPHGDGVLDDTEIHPEDITPSGVLVPGLGRLVNVAPKVTVGLQYADLAGRYLDFGSENPDVQSEIAALLAGEKPFPELYDYEKMDLDWATLRLMSCNASVIPAVLNSRGQPLDVGRAQRAFPSNIRRAVILRDGGCAYPGCNMPHIYSEVHHIEHWQDNGPTSLANAVMLCRFHHMIIHQTDVLVRTDDHNFPEFMVEPATSEARWVRNLMHRG